MATNARTIVFPNTTREIEEDAITRVSPRSVVLNEGLERLGAKETRDGWEYEGRAFGETAIESVRLPSTLKRIEREAFYQCDNLQTVEIPNGVEYIGINCFSSSRIEEIALPGTLREINEDALKYCWSLKTVWAEEGCTLDVRKYAKNGVEVRRK